MLLDDGGDDVWSDFCYCFVFASALFAVQYFYIDIQMGFLTNACCKVMSIKLSQNAAHRTHRIHIESVSKGCFSAPSVKHSF